MNEQNEQTNVQATGCFRFLDLIIFMFGSFILLGKTAHLLEIFAPDNWFGLTPNMYGIAAALMIEGYLVIMKLKAWISPPTNFMEWAMDFVMTLTPFLLSAFAQAADSWFTTGLIQNMSNEEKMFYTNVISILVAIPIFFAIIQTTIQNAPPGLFDSLKTKRKGDEGLGNVLGVVGKFFTKKPAKTTVVQTNLEVPEEKIEPSNNGKTPKRETDVNPK